MRKPLIILAVPALFLLGCKPKPAATNPSGNTPPAQPKACFTLSKTLIDSGETISTTNCSTNATSYDWNFGLGLQSSSAVSAPTFTYKDTLGFNPMRGTTYKVDLKVFGSGSSTDETYQYVTIGYRRIDSVVVSNVTGFVPDGTTQIEIQFGPGSNSSEYASSPQAPASWPCTFNLLADSIKIGPKNDYMSWSGIIIHASPPPIHTITAFGPPIGSPIYFSKGVNVSPIVVKDHSNPPFELDFYYTLVAH